VIYLELYQINIEFVAALKALGKRVILYHMGDEKGDKDLKGYEYCDLIFRNYYFSHIFNNPLFLEKLIWTPNGYRTGVGPRLKESVKGALERQCLASFLGWINNVNSYQNERFEFASAAPICGENLYILSSPSFAGLST
jgi:hypothetical protein